VKPTICVDLDGVLASWDGGTFWEIGNPIPGAVEFANRLAEIGDVIVYTCRVTERLYPPFLGELLAIDVEKWLRRFGFPEFQVWAEQGKPLADVYIDDRAVHCRPEACENPAHAYGAALAATLAMCDKQKGAAKA
jgi:hypothetical protein